MIKMNLSPEVKLELDAQRGKAESLLCQLINAKVYKDTLRTNENIQDLKVSFQSCFIVSLSN
jgi:hypothetical protein